MRADRSDKGDPTDDERLFPFEKYSLSRLRSNPIVHASRPLVQLRQAAVAEDGGADRAVKHGPNSLTRQARHPEFVEEMFMNYPG